MGDLVGVDARPDVGRSTRDDGGTTTTEVVWADRADLKAMDLVAGLWDALHEWGMLPR